MATIYDELTAASNEILGELGEVCFLRIGRERKNATGEAPWRAPTVEADQPEVVVTRITAVFSPLSRQESIAANITEDGYVGATIARNDLDVPPKIGDQIERVSDFPEVMVSENGIPIDFPVGGGQFERLVVGKKREVYRVMSVTANRPGGTTISFRVTLQSLPI